MSDELINAANVWREAGFGPLGTKPGEKSPKGWWKQYQGKAAPVEHVTAQLASGSALGLVVLPGQEALDIEGRFVNEGGMAKLLDRAADNGLANLVEKIMRGYHESSPSGGFHLLWRCDDTSGNIKLAQRPHDPATCSCPECIKGELGRDPLIETRGRGGFIVVAPSPGYQWQDGSPSTVVTISPDERDALLTLCRSFDEMPEREREPSFVDPQTNDRPGDDFNDRAGWDDVLLPHGWTHVGTGSRGESLWKRPGNTSAQWSATTNATGNHTLIVFSTSTPFDIAPTSYSKFSAYAVLNHRGDHKAAADDLRRQGYGSSSPSSISSTDETTETIEQQPARQVRLTPASAIRPRPVRWCWDARVPLGHVTITPGRGGVGKSTFHTWLIAQLTQGMLPGVYHGTPRSCVIAATEDDWSRTIVPRLIVAGADLALVHRADVVTSENRETTLNLPHDVDALADALVSIDAVLLSLDPMISTVSAALDTHKDRDVRQALEPLGRLADETGIAVLGNAHFSKGKDVDIMQLVMGSSAFGNVPRAALGFVRDDESDDGSCVITQAKNNLGRLDLPSLKYRIESVELDTDEGKADVGKLVMLGESERTASEILASSGDGEATKLKSAKDFLRTVMGAKVCQPSKDLEDEAKELHDISYRTLKRARQGMNLDAHKIGKTWYVKLPDDPHTCGRVPPDPDGHPWPPSDNDPPIERSTSCQTDPHPDAVPPAVRAPPGLVVGVPPVLVS